jgi:type I restriction-modification system DNA methylase subunit
MSKIYTCDLCKKIFNQKIDFTRHLNKKAPCISLTEIQKINQIKEVKMDIKTELINVLKNCLNILRDNEGLTGEKALRNMSYLLILKLIEPHLGNEIDIDNYRYDFSAYDFGNNEEKVTKFKNKLLKIARFSNLVKENENDITNNMKSLWDDILAFHPSTKNIFLKGKEFDIQHQSTYKKIIDKLNSIDLSQTDYDVLGNAYEEVIQDIMTGKVLGQFFTQPLVKKMMVKLINPQIYPDGKIDTCGDPTMGTGGFLITYLQYILQQAKVKNIKLDWNFIKSEGLYGKELEPDTYQLAVSNMLISSGHMFEGLERGDSIRQPITKKFDNILANPPFGIKGLNYDDIKNTLKSKYIPIKTDNAVSLFIQAIIYMLKIGGKCAVVLPDGQDLFSKTNTTLVAIREYLMKTCDLKEINYLPSGIFTYTNIKTCVFYFVKKREGTDVLETKIKVSKTQKETGRDYKFSKTHQTTKVKFYDYNPYEDVKNLLVEVPIEKIVSNSYSLNYAEYMKDETEEEQYEEGVIVKTLGELFKLNGNGKTNSKDITNTGEYPFYKASCNNPSGTHNTFDFDGKEYLLIVKSGGSSSKPISENYGIGKVFVVNGKCAANIAVFQLIPKTNDNFKYLSYYLKSIQNKIQGLAKYCTNNGNIDMKELMEIKVPIPSLEYQQEIVKYLDFIYEKANKTSNEKITELKKLNEFCLNNQKIFGENVVKELGDVFKEVKTGKDVVTTDRKKGEYPFYGANGIIDYVDSYIFDGKYLLTARTGSLGSLHISNGKFWCSGDVHRMEFENDTLLSYTYYYLQTIDFQKFRTGSAHPKLSSSSLKSIKIHIPSLECQKEIIEYCEHNDNLIKQLEKEIENNKKQAHQFIIGIIKSHVQVESEEQYNFSTENTKFNNKEKEDVISSVEENVISSVEENVISSVEENVISSIEEDVIIEIKENKKKVKKVKKSNVFIKDKD